MKTTRTAALAATAITGALLLAACGGSSSSSSTTSAAASSPAASDSASGGASGGANCVDGSIKASGSSAQANAMTEWINAYQTNCSGATIDYQPNGSGAGVQDFINKQTSFAGSDSAIKDADQSKADARCSAGPALNIPMVGGAISVIYNVQGADKIVLTPDVLAKIFANKITKWNDPAITALNSGVTLPDATIAQFHRSDASGTTDNFTKFLKAQAAADWTFDGGKEWQAPGGQGSKGSDGVTASVKSTPNSIGYVELSYAQDASLPSIWIQNTGGQPVEATSDNAAKTIATASVTGTGNNLPLKIDYATTTGYPIVLVTYEIACQAGLPADQSALVKSFLTYISSADGQAKLPDLGYVPITGDLLTKVQAAVASIS